MALLLYLDDVVLVKNDSIANEELKDYLNSHTCFSIKDLGPLKYFPNIEIAHGLSRIFFFQCKYTLTSMTF